MPCKNCPSKSGLCWLKESLQPPTADMAFKIHSGLKVQNAVCSDQPPTHPKIPVFWVLIIDQHIARILEKNSHLHEVVSLTPRGHDKNKHVHKEEIKFAKEVMDWLDGAAQRNLFDRLILCAPPSMLGEIRPLLSEDLVKHVVAEIDKDFTKLNEEDLKQRLSEILWFN